MLSEGTGPGNRLHGDLDWIVTVIRDHGSGMRYSAVFTIDAAAYVR